MKLFLFLTAMIFHLGVFAYCQENQYEILYGFEGSANLSDFILDISDDVTHYLGSWGYDGGDNSFELQIRLKQGRLTIKTIEKYFDEQGNPIDKVVDHLKCRIIGNMLISDDLSGLFVYFPKTQDYAFYMMEECKGAAKQFNSCGQLLDRYSWFDKNDNCFVLKEIRVNSQEEYETVSKQYQEHGMKMVDDYFQLIPNKFRLVSIEDDNGDIFNIIQSIEKTN